MSRHTSAWLLLAVLVLGVLVGAGVVAGTADRQQAETTAEQFAGDVDRVCQLDRRAADAAGADCGGAAQVVRDGVDGAPGVDGRGIVGTDVVDGRLVVAYSDGAREDAGQVVGRDGAPGPEGRGITDSDVVDGQLVVTYTDGTAAALGPVVGADGRGIASTAAVDGRLVVTYTDGATQDAGPLPPGPPGADGGPGADGAQGVQGVGVQEVRAEERDGGQCVLVFVLLDPADGATTEQAVAVSPRVCDGGGLVGP
jgi:hypothetical protein